MKVNYIYIVNIDIWIVDDYFFGIFMCIDNIIYKWSFIILVNSYKNLINLKLIFLEIFFRVLVFNRK